MNKDVQHCCNLLFLLYNKKTKRKLEKKLKKKKAKTEKKEIQTGDVTIVLIEAKEQWKHSRIIGEGTMSSTQYTKTISNIPNIYDKYKHTPYTSIHHTMTIAELKKIGHCNINTGAT